VPLKNLGLSEACLATLSSQGMLHCILPTLTGSIACICNFKTSNNVICWGFVATDFSGSPMKLYEKLERLVKELFIYIYPCMSICFHYFPHCSFYVLMFL
jgi:hypothetical protein